MDTRPLLATALAGLTLLPASSPIQDKPQTAPPRAYLDGTGPGWRALAADDFTDVNCKPDTFTFEPGGLIRCTGTPVGVIRTKEQLRNFELVVEWRHLKHAGNSGIFVWTPPSSLPRLKEGKDPLPGGIECQILDHGYAENWEKQHGKKPDWFTCHGDVFPCDEATMKPFPPMAPDKQRSFPSQDRSRPAGQWNHYYIRAINGEVRLWVNGAEVSGGTECKPAVGYLCLESEGSPIEFRNLRIRVLP